MGTKEQLILYTEKMSVKFFEINYPKISALEKQVGKYLQRYITEKGFEMAFTSSELRRFTMALDKVHKSLNNIISFTTLKKKFDKYKLVGAEEIVQELSINATHIGTVSKLQFILGNFNRYCVLLDLLEKSAERQREQDYLVKLKEKEEDDEIFRHSIYEALVEVC